jgi:hypothetical protein
MIEYLNNMPVGYKVKLDGKVVGEIKRLSNGWQYYPINAKFGGMIFDTLVECKRSLEED